MHWEWAYLAAWWHDLGKLALRRDLHPNGGPTNAYGIWSKQHKDLRNKPGGPVDLHPNVQDAACVRDLIREGPPFETDLVQFPERQDLHLVLALADQMHKSLYLFSRVRQPTTSPQGEVSNLMRFPFFLPFYGDRLIWLPEVISGGNLRGKQRYKDMDERYMLSEVQDFQRADAGKQFAALRQAMADRMKPKKPLTPRDLRELAEEYLADFPDSTYWPVSSLAFHGRFTAALVALLRPVVEEVWPTVPESHPLNLYLSVIQAPPERLQHRLRAMSAVRKISHRLQRHLHEHLRQKYLDPLQMDFSRPEDNPLLFYCQDAFVLLHAESDLEAVRGACRELADEFGVTFSWQRLKMPFVLKPHSSQPLGEPLPPGPQPADHRPHDHPMTEEWETFLPLPNVPDTEKNCADCGCPDQKLQRANDPTRDWLCSPCCELRKETLRDGPQLGEILHRQARVAYVLLRTNCCYRGDPVRADVRTEADALLAEFRQARNRFQVERDERGHFVPAHSRAWAEARTTAHGVFEYLQATLAVNQLQEDLAHALGHQSFLYRTPTLTVLVLEEAHWPDFWKQLQSIRKQLHLSHVVRVTTCSANTPVWAVVRDFLNVPDLLPPGLRQQAEKISEVAAQLNNDPQQGDAPDDVSFVFREGAAFVAALQQARADATEKHSGLFLQRGQITRRLSLAALDFQDAYGPEKRPTPSQLHATAGLAQALAHDCALLRSQPQPGPDKSGEARSNLLMEIASRRPNWQVPGTKEGHTEAAKFAEALKKEWTGAYDPAARADLLRELAQGTPRRPGSKR